MAKRAQGKIVWITGASSGLGAAMARAFAARGADVAVSARRTDRLDALVEELSASGVRALAVPCDVVDEASVAGATKEVVAAFGGIDIAVANAGFGVSGSIESVDLDAWRRQFDTNVFGVVSTAQAALPFLRERRGSLALVGSVSAQVALPGTGPYSASKYAVRAIGQVLAAELQSAGVSVTTLHPGFVASEIGQVDNAGQFDEQRSDPRPKAFMWPTQKAGDAMADAILTRRREVVITGHGKVGAWFGRHAPGLVHFALTRGGAKS
jgi:NAD(P)-dependent dehydrogenase (short-subunit alcohol dehydrogenase family)